MPYIILFPQPCPKAARTLIELAWALWWAQAQSTCLSWDRVAFELDWLLPSPSNMCALASSLAGIMGTTDHMVLSSPVDIPVATNSRTLGVLRSQSVPTLLLTLCWVLFPLLQTVHFSLVWWPVPVSPNTWEAGAGGSLFKATLGYIVRSCLKNKTKICKNSNNKTPQFSSPWTLFK